MPCGENEKHSRSVAAANSTAHGIQAIQAGAQSPHPLQLTPATGTVRILLSGILIVAASDDGNRIVVMPSASRERQSKTSPSEFIPPHRPWILAKTADLDANSRDRDFGINQDVYSVFLLDHEMVEFFADELDLTGKTLAADPLAVHLSEICGHSAIAHEHVDFPPTDKVAAQVKLPALPITKAAITPLEFLFRPNCDLLNPPPQQRALAHVGAMDLAIGGAAFELRSRPFDGSAGARPIRFARSAKGRLFMVGQTPVGDIEAFVNTTTPHIHTGPDVHFELYYDLVKHPGNHDLIVPVGVVPSLTLPVEDPVPHVGNCPYGFADVAPRES
jgi:hypothetical protein